MGRHNNFPHLRPDRSRARIWPSIQGQQVDFRTVQTLASLDQDQHGQIIGDKSRPTVSSIYQITIQQLLIIHRHDHHSRLLPQLLGPNSCPASCMSSITALKALATLSSTLPRSHSPLVFHNVSIRMLLTCSSCSTLRPVVLSVISRCKLLNLASST